MAITDMFTTEITSFFSHTALLLEAGLGIAGNFPDTKAGADTNSITVLTRCMLRWLALLNESTFHYGMDKQKTICFA